MSRGPLSFCPILFRLTAGASGLKEVASRRLITLSALVDIIDAQRQQGNLSSALRLFVLDFYRSQIPEVEEREGHREMLERPKPLLS